MRSTPPSNTHCRGRRPLSLHLLLSVAVFVALLALLCPSALSQSPLLGYCSSFGHCDTYDGEQDVAKSIDCVNSPPIRSLPPTFNLSLCPHLQQSGVCCDSVQYAQFAFGFSELSTLLSPCPACLENFRSVLCDLSCGGSQASFTTVTGSAPSTTSNSTVVTRASVSISLDVVDRLYASCKDVQYATTGKSVLATSGVENAQQIFTFLIDSRSPVHYDWTFIQSGADTPALSLDNLQRDMWTCDNKTSNFTCTCGDCPTVCNRCPVPQQSNDSSLVVDGVWPTFGHNYLHPIVYACLAGLSSYIAVLLIAAVVTESANSGSLLSSPYLRRLLGGVAVIAGAALMVYAVSVLWLWTQKGQEVTVGDEAGMVGAFQSYFDPVFFAFLHITPLLLLLTLVYVVYRYIRAHRTPFTYHPSTFAPSTASLSDLPVSPSTPLARYSSFIAHHPFLVISAALLLTGLASLGLLQARLESDPVTLWVSPTSQVLKDKLYFDSTFGAFYRTEQLIITRPQDRTAPILTASALLLLTNLTAAIRALHVPFSYDNGTVVDVSLERLCYRPIPGQGCVVESPLEWFNRTQADDSPPPLDGQLTDSNVTDWVSRCANNVILDECRGSIGAPTYPYIVLGGYQGDEYTTATALVVTFPLNNAEANVPQAEAWEAALLSLLQSSSLQQLIASHGLHVDYMLERSVADEIQRGTYKDVGIISLSYALMLVYISVALSSGYWRSPPSSSACTFPLHTKFVLGLSSLLIVLCALLVSVSLVSVLGIAVTPIISEVIPFLVLAIGVDNVFLLSHAFRRQPVYLTPATRLHLTLQEVGVGIALAAASECGAFLLGASSNMPAVQAFAAISAVAIAVDWLLQMTVFCAVMVLDARRMEDGRWDLCPCVRDLHVKREVDAWKAARGGRLSADDHEDEEEDGDDPPPSPSPSVQSDDVHGSAAPSPFTSESYLQLFLRRFYLPFLFHPAVRLVVLLLFPTLFFTLLSYGLTHLQLGLDQATVVPDDSYLQGYFASESAYLNVGPPVYFVLKNSTLESPSLTYDYASYALQDRVCNAVSNCDDSSLEGIISAAACTPGSYIAQPASSWMDTYMVWLASPSCCSFLPDAPGVLASPDDCDFGACTPCMNATSYSALYGRQRPPPDVFEQWMQQWLINSSCTGECAFCSAGVFDSITYTTQPLPNDSSPLVNTTVRASRYMSYHTPLRTQADFIGAIRSGQDIAERIQREQGLNVFPYSVIYVYFQQYLDIQQMATLNISLAFLAIFLLSLVLLRCVWISLLQVLTIVMIVGDLLGCMALWSIDVNALSVLNLIMAIGISVEFCIHLSTRFLLTPAPSRTARAAHAMYTVGTSVVEGITLTKVTGVVVLAFATSAVFSIYYFRMYLLIVLLGVSHGCVWLPVLLSVAGSEAQQRDGGQGWCGGWMWGWPCRRCGAQAHMEDEPWVVVDDDGQAQEEQPQTSDDEGPEGDDYERDEQYHDDDEEVAASSRRGRSARVVDAPGDERERALLDEEAEARRTQRWR